MSIIGRWWEMRRIGTARIAALEADVAGLRATVDGHVQRSERDEALIDRLWAQLGSERARSSLILDRLMALKVAGASGGAVPTSVTPERGGLPAEVEQALDWVGDPSAEPLARRWMSEGVEPEEIARRVMVGGEVMI
jgi:hypothetical protein